MRYSVEMKGANLWTFAGWGTQIDHIADIDLCDALAFEQYIDELFLEADIIRVNSEGEYALTDDVIAEDNEVCGISLWKQRTDYHGH